VQFVHSKALSEVNDDLEDKDHRNGDSARIGPAARLSAIPKSKLEQVQSEVMSITLRFENGFCWCSRAFGFGGGMCARRRTSRNTTTRRVQVRQFSSTEQEDVSTDRQASWEGNFESERDVQLLQYLHLRKRHDNHGEWLQLYVVE
jgi:hypothetical protein